MKLTSTVCLGLIVSLTGCSQLGGGTQTQSQTMSAAHASCGKAVDADTSMNLDLIEQLMTSGRLHAALAHLDNLQSTSPYATYLRAEILRQSDRNQEAAEYYLSLLQTCMVGEAHHGLGLIAGRKNLLNKAVEHLTVAAEQLPVNARIRNDLGYALLLQGHFEKAQHEFITALELDQDARLAETNMMILLLATGEQSKAEAFARRINMDPQTVADLNEQAMSIRAQTRSR
ncbi:MULTISPECIES: hypothetical protein [unclassified Methylophaga]|jgi:Flp pilus assembly protein TadD|uniref:tetratricopeptide repeat protein n=1 Tax=unclassified Methylophaga TaxID=2629249 RepID=UPI000C8A225B|nr:MULTISPECIES: hypothetical protein [unclassified Methylophaga]MAK66109.1 hypothetical protein [Methylophaga sp.]MAY17305.1 hypothetical protein [Methylophaga sp.]HAO26348.1 hypothetical protein [Methylophaga sp.]HCD06041.1 hypothetical protein [Methylophaga sp.]|tara:strand:- start:16164 stop:16853 length:690 start_codon:yes stop_codon:yes gene_type:complete